MVLAAGVPLVVHAALASPAVAAWLANWWVCLVGIGAVGLLAALLASRSPADRPLAAIGITLFAVTYAAALPAFLLGIRHGSWPTGSWGGTALVFFPLVVTWVTDTAAMFGGKAIGGPQLAPVISPGKTRAGGVAGLVGGALVGLLFATAVFPRVGVPLAVGPAIVVALLLAVVGQAGDLVESLFKREAGVKDSSGLIPGHGGVLDRFDSLYVVLPVAAACFRILGLI
jgi:phosphatidate cytidylyltransferase